MTLFQVRMECVGRPGQQGPMKASCPNAPGLLLQALCNNDC